MKKNKWQNLKRIEQYKLSSIRDLEFQVDDPNIHLISYLSFICVVTSLIFIYKWRNFYTYLYMNLETAYFITFNYRGIHKSMNLDKKNSEPLIPDIQNTVNNCEKIKLYFSFWNALFFPSLIGQNFMVSIEWVKY